MISSTLVEESNGNVSNYIKPGIGTYKIAHMEHVTPEQGSPHIKLYMESEPMTELGGQPQKGEFTMYTTERATPFIMKQIVAIAKACGTSKEELDKLTANSWGEYLNLIKPIVIGKFLRFKFKGEEVFSKGKETTWLKAVLPMSNFVESLTEATKLNYNPEKDVKKLPTPDVEDMAATSDSDGMPF